MRIRTIKPEFFTHEGLFDAEKTLGLPLRVAYAGLWCAADKKGRFKWEPRRLGVAILPYDEIDFSRVLDACLTRGFIVKYRVGDAWFGAIPSWSKHQFVNNRETDSTIPDVKDAEELDACLTREARVGHASHKEGKGREGERKGKGMDSIAPADADAMKDPPFDDLPKAKPRNPLIDALAACGGADPLQIPPRAWSAIGAALADIKAVCPDLTVNEIARRSINYRSHMRDATLTPHALAKNWALCDKPAVRTGKSTGGELDEQFNKF